MKSFISLLAIIILSGCASSNTDLLARIDRLEQQVRDRDQTIAGIQAQDPLFGTPEGNANTEANRQQVRAGNITQMNGRGPANGVGGGVPAAMPETRTGVIVPQQPMPVSAASIGGPAGWSTSDPATVTIFTTALPPGVLVVMEVNGYAIPVQGGGQPVGTRDASGRPVYGVPSGTAAYMYAVTQGQFTIRYQCYRTLPPNLRVPGQPAAAMPYGNGGSFSFSTESMTMVNSVPRLCTG